MKIDNLKNTIIDEEINNEKNNEQKMNRSEDAFIIIEIH